MKSIIQDHCWVCGERFTTSIPPGRANEERHHILPRAFGGTDGPVVSLCDSCHSKVHKLSYDPSKIPMLCKGYPLESINKLIYLCGIIYKAKRLLEQDPNKLLPMTFKITKGDAEKLDRLKSVLNVKSRAAVYAIALTRLYNQHFSAQ